MPSLRPPKITVDAPFWLMLDAELGWINHLLLTRSLQPEGPLELGSAPPLMEGSEYAAFLETHQLSLPERATLAFLLAGYLDDGKLEPMIQDKNPARLAVFEQTGALVPTVTSLLYFLGGTRLVDRLPFRQLFQTDHLFYRKSVIEIDNTKPGAPDAQSLIRLSRQFAELFIENRYRRPRFSHEFPAHLLETDLEWEDLILNPSTQVRLEELKSWFQHVHVLSESPLMARHLKPGYRCLFSGPSGTGKTLAATLLGKYLNREVFRVDLSAVVSKYVGETSKNLNALFDTAEGKDWVLFFDEGDALFGKRIDTSVADNKNAAFVNQDVAFLLQRIESFRGVVIVATNFRKNMDSAFSRRFNQVVHFDLPNLENSLRMWQDFLPDCVEYPPELNFDLIARRYQLSCANIVNIVQRVSVMTLAKGEKVISLKDLNQCINDESVK